MFETQFKYQYPNQNQRPVRYILPGNLKQKYDEIPEFEDILRSTQRCPFTSIRQLLITFKRTDPFDPDVQLCDLLREKYAEYPQYLQVENQLAALIKDIDISSIRAQNLFGSIQQYLSLYRQLSQGNTQFEITQKIFTSPLPSTPQQCPQPYKQDHQFCSLDSQYHKFTNFSQQLERAFILISVIQAQKFQLSATVPKVDNIRQFYQNWKDIRKLLNQAQGTVVRVLFRWRGIVKGAAGGQGAGVADVRGEARGVVEKWKRGREQIDIGYMQMADFSALFEKDRREIMGLYHRRSAAYRQFLPQFLKFSESEYVKSQQNIYYDVILQQKYLLQSHMKKNYGLVVPYTPSGSFLKTISPLQKGQKIHIKQLLSQKLSPIEDGMLYLNGEYEKLYKRICDSREPQSCLRDIQKWIIKFNGYAGDSDNRFVIHLGESCQKLLRLIK